MHYRSCSWDRLRRRSALRSLVCPRRILRGHGHAGVAVEPSGCGGVVAFQGCIFGAVFRFGRHAFRSAGAGHESRYHVLAVVGIIVFGKSLAAFVLVLLFRYPLNTALTVSAGLAQIGEFSFILAGLGLSLGILPEEGRSLILAGAIISIAVNPLVFHAIEPSASMDSRQVETRSTFRASRRPAGDPAHDDRSEAAHWPCRSRRLRPRWAAHRRGTCRAWDLVRARGRKSRDHRSGAGERDLRRSPEMLPSP